MKILIVLFLFETTLCGNLFLKDNSQIYDQKPRNLWEEEMHYDKEDRNKLEYDSIDHCGKSSYKYFSYLISGQKVIFDKTINHDNAVRNKL